MMNPKIEKEVKFAVNDISNSIESIRRIATYSRTEYLRDIIYGCDQDKRKIRLRVKDNFENLSIEAIYKYKIEGENGIKTEIEETIYKGNNKKDAIEAISRHGDFKEENSYEKIRAIYLCGGVEITLDIYPYGTWIEVEGEENKIWEAAEKLGYKKTKGITLNADELYLEWNKQLGLKEFWDVRFGLAGEK